MIGRERTVGKKERQRESQQASKVTKQAIEVRHRKEIERKVVMKAGRKG